MPSVFISYSHDRNDPTHGEKVAGLAAALLEEGLKVYFDQNRGDDEQGVPWPIWMESKIADADFVLLVCTELYLAKVQQRVDPSEGLGVCWEANLIYNALYQAKLNTTKFLPVVFDSVERKFIPGPLTGANNFVVDSDAAFTQLYAFLTGQHRALFPTQGPATAVIPQKTVKPLFSLKKSVVSPAKPQPEPTAPGSAPPPATQQFNLKTDIPPSPRHDIRGLDWYEECDAQHFLGRDEDSSRLLSMLLTQPVIRLIGPSGVGKSSLIRAGLLPKIREFGWRACVLRPFENPAQRIPEQLSESLLVSGSFFSTPLNAASLRAELTRALTATGTKRLVLLLDQFEDIVSPSADSAAVDSMRLWLRELWENAQSMPFLRVIVVYRTDADARLGRLWQEGTGRLEGLPYLPVEGLSQEVAEKVIRQTAQERGWKIEVNLPDITRQLALESQKLGCSGDIFPVYLQILLKQVADTGGGRLSEDLMQTLGGISGLIVRFLEQSLARLKARGGDWLHCGRILETLSRSSGTKSALSLGEMVRECGISRTALIEMLPMLIGERLVRPVGHETYEIQHDRLACAVIESMKEEDLEAKQAREFLAAKIPLFERTRTPLSGPELVYLYRHRRHIHPTPRELSVILVSALNALATEKFDDDGFEAISQVPFTFWFSEQTLVEWRKLIIEVVEWEYDNQRMLHSPDEWVDHFPASTIEENWKTLSQHPAPPVRRLCAVWLKTVEHDKKLVWLRDLSKDQDDNVRLEVVKAITHHQQEQILLHELAKDQDNNVRLEAVKAIIGFLQEQDLPLLSEMIKDRAEQVRREVAKAIANFQQEQNLPLLREMVKDRNIYVRIEALKAIAGFQQEQDLPLLREMITDSSGRVSREAAKAIAGFPKEQALPLLRELTKDRNNHVRLEAAKAIAGFQQEQDLKMLLEMVKDRNNHVRREAVKAIAGFPQEQALPPLREMAKDRNNHVRREAVKAIAYFRKEQDLPLLRAIAKDKDYDVCLESVKAIVDFHQEQALPILREMLKHQHWQMRLEAMRTIAGFRQEQDLPLLRKMAKDQDNDVRRVAVKAIAGFQQDEDLTLLREMAKDQDDHIGKEAVKAIASFVSATRKPFLIELTLSPDNEISGLAATSLESLLSHEEMEAFISDQEKTLSAGALAALDTILYMPSWLKAGLGSAHADADADADDYDYYNDGDW